MLSVPEKSKWASLNLSRKWAPTTALVRSMLIIIWWLLMFCQWQIVIQTSYGLVLACYASDLINWVDDQPLGNVCVPLIIHQPANLGRKPTFCFRPICPSKSYDDIHLFHRRTTRPSWWWLPLCARTCTCQWSHFFGGGFVSVRKHRRSHRTMRALSLADK